MLKGHVGVPECLLRRTCCGLPCAPSLPCDAISSSSPLPPRPAPSNAPTVLPSRMLPSLPPQPLHPLLPPTINPHPQGMLPAAFDGQLQLPWRSIAFAGAAPDVLVLDVRSLPQTTLYPPSASALMDLRTASLRPATLWPCSRRGTLAPASSPCCPPRAAR